MTSLFNNAKPNTSQRRGHAVSHDYSVIFKQIFLIAIAIVVLLPLYFMVITPLKTQEAYALNKLSLPTHLYFGSFAAALRGGRFFIWFKNSILLTGGAVIVSTLVSVLGAFAFSRMEFRGRHPLLSVMSSLMVVPPVVMIVPLFLLFSRLRMTSTYASAILVYAGLITPFAVYMLTNFFKNVPHEIIESALIDGASSLDILLKIMVPLSAPAIVTMVVVNSLWVWNDLLIALVLLPDDNMRTLMVGITVFGSRYNKDVPISMAGMLMASIPMFVLYLLGQKYFTRGLVAGALKG
jgi:raffinose/stachyose/melibiose transport system permease protein